MVITAVFHFQLPHLTESQLKQIHMNIIPLLNNRCKYNYVFDDLSTKRRDIDCWVKFVVSDVKEEVLLVEDLDFPSTLLEILLDRPALKVEVKREIL